MADENISFIVVFLKTSGEKKKPFINKTILFDSIIKNTRFFSIAYLTR